MMMTNQANIPLKSDLSTTPGRLRPYICQAEVILFDGNRDAALAAMHAQARQFVQDEWRVGILSTDEEANLFNDVGARVISMGSRSNIRQVSRVIYRALQALDHQHVDKVLVRSLHKDGDGQVLWDWLVHVAKGRVRTF